MDGCEMHGRYETIWVFFEMYGLSRVEVGFMLVLLNGYCSLLLTVCTSSTTPIYMVLEDSIHYYSYYYYYDFTFHNVPSGHHR